MNTRITNFANRELHLIDIENELGTARPQASDIARFRDFYLTANNVPADAHIIIAASGSDNLLQAGIGWPGARRVWLSGHDGADRALIDVVLDEDVENRFGHVVIGSGDHIFADAVEYLERLGVHVKVFARVMYVSAEIRERCQNVELYSSADFCLAA
jgi:hypothetical protein